MEYIGVILAGGQSRRFGSPKAFAKKDGNFFYTYSAKALEAYTSKLVLVTNQELAPVFSQEGFTGEIINDIKEYEGQGPLAGIYSAMEKYPADWYIVSPIDVPFIDQAVIKLLLSNIKPNIEAIIPVVAGKKQPLIALYHHDVKILIKRKLDRGLRSIEMVLADLNVHYISIADEQPFINVNSKVDYEKYIE
ncbi:molybdenum cofactor guanylyltransferase [Oceanobacillus chungangensis]|uniref:molybdenum cofactor guanylyltransferase n=1 Tax=Oceanobacillus chungangensis TaxID=1229152 RepID=UPI0014759FE6|nr:molybdenum cofactor guanylyltransferase [Oceanobacillus chungangensis]